MENQIERDVYVTTNATVKNPIDYVAGTNALPIVFNFRDFDIPDGAEATYYVKKPSKKAVWNTATISGNTVTIPVTTQTFAEEGINNLQVRITQGEEILVTFTQPVKSWPNHTNDDAEESTNESDLLDQYIQEMQEKGDRIIGRASQYAQEAEAGGDAATAAAAQAKSYMEQTQQLSITNVGNITFGIDPIKNCLTATYNEEG